MMESAVGPSPQLSLRVSAATLSRIVFPHPNDNSLTLALEHKATLHHFEDKPVVTLMAQPFGGAVRIVKPQILLNSITEFSYDSERSLAEKDLRIFIQPSKWPALLEICRHEAALGEQAALDHDPVRELVEEFEDTLGIQLMSDDYTLESVGLVIEKVPHPTANVRAPGYPTARVYWVDEVRITDGDMCRQMLNAGLSTEALREKAMEDWKNGGPGRANAIFTAPLKQLRAAYLKLSPEERSAPLEFEGVTLSSNVPAILESVDTPTFEGVG